MSGSDEPIQRIGEYEVFRKLATGPLADLFLAKQIGLDGFEKVVVIRKLHDDLSSDYDFLNMFLDEARLVAHLSHPNIVQIYDLGKDEEAYFISMEYVPGRTLAAVARKARRAHVPLPPEYVARCLIDVCAGLHHAHTRVDPTGKPLDIVHRGVSPDSVIVAFSGVVKLGDFGVAKAATRFANTRTGVLRGKYGYMSPEQVRGETADARADVFAAGVVLYELLTGRNPFERGNAILTLNAIATEDPPECRDVNKTIPVVLAEIIGKALRKRRSKRWQSAAELQVALEDYLVQTGKRCDGNALGKWVTELFADDIPGARMGSLAADVLVEEEEGTQEEFDVEESTDGALYEEPEHATEIVPADETTIQPKAAFRMAAATELAPFHDASTSFEDTTNPDAAFEEDSTADGQGEPQLMPTRSTPFGDIPTASLGALAEAAAEIGAGEGIEVGFEVDFSSSFEISETNIPAPDPADSMVNAMELRSPVGARELSAENVPEERSEHDAEDPAEVRAPPLKLSLPLPPVALPPAAQQDSQVINDAFAAFSIDDEVPVARPPRGPIPFSEPTAPLPDDALLDIPPESVVAAGVKPPKRNIVEIHRPGPAAPTEFLSDALKAQADLALLGVNVSGTPLPVVLRERDPAPMILDPDEIPESMPVKFPPTKKDKGKKPNK